MLQGAMLEMLWVIVIFGVPILMAVGWVRFKDWYDWRNSYKNQIRFITYVQDSRSRQKAKDDYIFNTVREWRNELG